MKKNLLTVFLLSAANCLLPFVSFSQVCFSNANNFPITGSTPYGIAVADFNGDNKKDLVSANWSTGEISYLLGDGAGNFGADNPISVGGANLRSIISADFNHDTKADLAVADYGGNAVYVLLGDGAGNFSASPAFSAGNRPYSVVSADFNNDGNPDLAVCNLISNNVSILLGNGAGSFGTATNFSVGSHPYSISIGDFNKDGNADFATANNGSDNISVRIGDGSGGFGAVATYSVGTGPNQVISADFNNDNNPDLAVANYGSNNVSILLGNGSGTFGAVTNFPAGLSLYSLTSADLDKDGNMDLATASSSSGLYVLLGNGAGSFGAAVNFTAGGSPAYVINSDLNADGRIDLLIANASTNNVSVFLNCTALSITAAMLSDVSCKNGSDGSAKATVVTGTPPYTYSWNSIPAQTTATATGLSAGVYSVLVTDHLSTTDTKTVSIAEPALLTLTVSATNVSCHSGNDGSLHAPTSGGTSPYTYLWYPYGQTTQTVTGGVAAGTYSVDVHDANNCLASSQTITVSEPTAITFSVTQTNVSCHGGSTGSFTVTATGGTGAKQYSDDNGNTFQSSAFFSGLTATTYQVKVRDINLCVTLAQAVTITEPNALGISFTPTNAICYGQSNGSLFANVSGGTFPYTYAWNTSPVQTTSTASNIAAGTHTVTVTDNAGCFLIQTGSVSQPNNLVVSANSVVKPVCDHSGTALAIANGGTAAYTYLWSTGQSGISATATGLSAGTYTVSAKDINGCTSSASSFTVTNDPPSAPSICVVSVDSLSTNNLIVWDKSSYLHGDTFLIYRDTANNAYGLIGKVPFTALSMFTDTVRSRYAANGNPNVTSWRYKIAVKDSCGNSSPKSPYHQSIYIQNSSGNFSWNHYQIEGQIAPVPALTNYLFQRDNLSNGTYVTIQTLSASSTSYTDPLYATFQSTATWRVKTLWNISCTPALEKNQNPDISSIALNSSRSNVYRTNNPTAMNETMLNNSVKVSPNPSSGVFQVLSDRYQVSGTEIYDVYGECIYRQICTSSNCQIDLSYAKSGIYFLHLQTEQGTAVKKIVINK